MITLHISLYKLKPNDTGDYTVDYTEPHFHPKNQLALFEPNEIEDKFNITFAQIQEATEKLTRDESGWIVGRVVSICKLPFRDINP